jgi:hypothetical protein
MTKPTAESFSAPILNINGSSPETMVKDILAALNALNNASAAIAMTAPHPRDWQTAADGDALFAMARDQHRARLYRLGVIHAELEAIGISIQDQADKRARR